MKTGFKNIMQPKEKTFKNPWDFTAPAYDERSSCFINAGSQFGTGKTQPIGSLNHTSSGGVPKGRVDTLRTFNVPYERLEEQ